jgi:hypothetical protein
MVIAFTWAYVPNDFLGDACTLFINNKFLVVVIVHGEYPSTVSDR